MTENLNHFIRENWAKKNTARIKTSKFRDNSRHQKKLCFSKPRSKFSKILLLHSLTHGIFIAEI